MVNAASARSDIWPDNKTAVKFLLFSRLLTVPLACPQCSRSNVGAWHPQKRVVECIFYRELIATELLLSDSDEDNDRHKKVRRPRIRKETAVCNGKCNMRDESSSILNYMSTQVGTSHYWWLCIGFLNPWPKFLHEHLLRFCFCHPNTHISLHAWTDWTRTARWPKHSACACAPRTCKRAAHARVSVDQSEPFSKTAEREEPLREQSRRGRREQNQWLSEGAWSRLSRLVLTKYYYCCFYNIIIFIKMFALQVYILIMNII